MEVKPKMKARLLGRFVLVFIIVALTVLIALTVKKSNEFNRAHKDYMQDEYPKREQLFGDMLGALNERFFKKQTINEAAILDHLGPPDFLRVISGERDLVYHYIHYDREYMAYIMFTDGKLKRIHRGTRFPLPEDYKPCSVKRPNQQVDPIVKTPADKVEAQGTQGHP